MTENIRPPAVAGTFYPSDPQNLRSEIQRYLENAENRVTDHSPVRAVIVPHAGYIFSGPVAAYAYKLLQREPTPKRIILMGPSHRAWFQGIAAADVDAFRTPLGNQPVDRDYIVDLVRNYPQFSASNGPHEMEHCLEVQVPFIQMIYPGVPLVPLLFGHLDPLEIGEVLLAVIAPGDIIIVSSDLSHYHPNTTAHALDGQFINAVLEGQVTGVAQGEACGQVPTMSLMTIAAARGWKPHLLDYRTSGDIMGDRSQVVGYAAIAYTEGN